MDFLKRYSNLNESQKKAVDIIDGPLMVIAGPGTGKTELLSVRIANILQKTDTLPENILCLTFTDSAASAMRKRLAEIIGKESYKVAVHTFHSFGSEIINQNGQYFYQGAHFRPADQLSSYEIIRNIFETLGYENPIAGKLNDEFTYLSDSLTAISELKKSGLTSDELLKILDENDLVIEKTEQLLAPVFDDRISKKTADLAAKHIKAIRDSNGKIDLPTIVPLSRILADSLEAAVGESLETNSTKPITAWRNAWFKKDDRGKFILKSRERQVKLRSLSFVYEQYLNQMQEAALYDFDDMILRVVHAMEIFDDLRFNLQEKYQYILVDEFQDTNMAQMRILHNLTNNPAQGDTPNIMVVGDDDQAIYSFQGADISNILDFDLNYPKAEKITLTENYRSTASVLDNSRSIIVQGKNRLENRIDSINKQLTAHNNTKGDSVSIFEAESISDERHWLVNDIKSRIESGEIPSDIAVLTRRHSEIMSLLPYFSRVGIAVNYERRDNALDQPPIKLIEQVSRLLIDIATGQHDDINALLPEVLAHKAWGIAPIDLWKLSLKAHDSHTRWLDVMETIPKFKNLHAWFINTAFLINDTPLEQMLDIIVGNPAPLEEYDDTQFISPLYQHFFSADTMDNQPTQYLTYLESLRAIRSKLREYRPNQTPTLTTFIDFITLNRKIGSTISISRRSIQSDKAINLMTAHKSKGLEFNTVYIINAIDSVWGERARSRNRLIGYPENLPLAPAGETDDERLRLFYVSMTRAKQQLNISYALNDDADKGTLRASFLVGSLLPTNLIKPPAKASGLVEAVELAWYKPLTDPVNLVMRDLLLPKLENYKLSVTHLHNFLDVTRGGPSMFLLQNLLHFPRAKSPSAAYGTAVHDTMQHAHSYFAATGNKQAIEDIIAFFETNLKNQYLSSLDFERYLTRGSDALRTFFDKKYDSFKPSEKAEINFSNQHSIINKAHLTGKLDLANIDKASKTLIITDYKTGRPTLSWNGKTDFEKIKLHRYRQQLLFYKLLVENARDWRGYSVETGVMQYIEPTAHGDIVSLETGFSREELDNFAKLINIVWNHITDLNLPDTSSYDQSFKGILAFEKDLIDNII